MPSRSYTLGRLFKGEALQTFKFGNFLATAVMVGVAAESILQKIVDAVKNALDTTTKKSSFESALNRRKTAKNHHQQVIACLKSSTTPLPTEFDEVLLLHIEGIFHLIRRTRNDAGHPSGTKLSKNHSSLYGLFVALIFPVATPMTRTRSPCATNSGGFGYFISTSLDAFLRKAANSACPRYVPASGQPPPGMIHSEAFNEKLAKLGYNAAAAKRKRSHHKQSASEPTAAAKGKTKA
jgi:hypothetical protein